MSLSKKLDEVYIFHLEKAYKQFRKYKTAYFRQKGIDITSDQWVLLKGISEQEGLNQKELSERTYKEPASVTRILDILERKGWIERSKIEHNRRTYALHTTEDGKKLIKKVLPMAVELRAKGIAGLTEAEVNELNRMLIRVFQNFQ